MSIIEEQELKQLLEEAKDPSIQDLKNSRIMELKTMLADLVAQRELLLNTNNGNSFSDEKTKKSDNERRTRLSDIISLGDKYLEHYDEQLKIANERQLLAEQELYLVEKRIFDTKQLIEQLVLEAKKYNAEEKTEQNDVVSIELITTQLEKNTQALKDLMAERNGILKQICEIVKNKASIKAQSFIINGNIADDAEKQRQLDKKIETHDYIDYTEKACYEANLAYIDGLIQDCSQTIDRLTTNPNELFRKAMSALNKGDENYQEYKDALTQLSSIEITPNYPVEVETYQITRPAKPSDARLRQIINMNKDALPSIKIKTNFKSNKNATIIVDLVDLINLKIRYMVEREILGEKVFKRCDTKISEVDELISKREEDLYNSEIELEMNRAKQRSFELAIKGAERSRFILNSKSNENELTYADENDILLASHITSSVKKQKSELEHKTQSVEEEQKEDALTLKIENEAESNDIIPPTVSYQEIEPETYQIDDSTFNEEITNQDNVLIEPVETTIMNEKQKEQETAEKIAFEPFAKLPELEEIDIQLPDTKNDTSTTRQDEMLVPQYGIVDMSEFISSKSRRSVVAAKPVSVSKTLIAITIEGIKPSMKMTV